MSIWSDLGNALTTIGDTVASPFVTGYQVTAAAMENAERAVVDESLRLGDAVSNLGMIVGDGVVSAADVVGQGVVTFGTDAQKFSIAGGGAVVDWTKTTAGEVQSWTLGTAGNVSAFSQSVYGAAKQDCLTAANLVAANGTQWAAFIASLFTSTLPKLGGYDSTARSIANVLFPGLAGAIESRARSDGTTIGFDFKLTVGPLNPRVGLYVDSTGQWGFYDSLQLTLESLNISTSNLTSVSGAAEVITVFGPRDAFSERAVVAIGGNIRSYAGSIGASVYLTTHGHFVGFRVQVTLGFSLSPILTGGYQASLKAPQPNGTLLTLGIDEYQKSMSDGGPNWAAATRTMLTPDQEPRVVATAAAATLSPFKPRYYGALRNSAAQPLFYYVDQSAQTAPSTPAPNLLQSATPPTQSTWRLVSGLSNKNLVSIEIMIFGVPYYLFAGDGGPFFPMRYTGQAAEQCSFQVIPAVSGAPNAISFLSSTGSLIGGADYHLTPASALTDAQKCAFSFFIDQPATMSDPNQTTSLNVGDVLHVGDYRRSGDGSAFLTLQPNGSLATALGSDPANNRGAVWNSPPSTAAGPFYAVMQPSGSLAVFQGADPSSGGAQVWASDVLGTPGNCFAAVANNGNFVVFQGSTDAPGELVYSSVNGAAPWVQSRRPRVALLTNDGAHYLSSTAAAGMCYTSNSTPLVANIRNIGRGEVFTLETLYNGKVALRDANMNYVTAQSGGGTTLVTTCGQPYAYSIFTPVYPSGGQLNLQANNGMFVSANQGGGSNVTVDRPVASTWETFTLVDIPGDLGIIYPPDDPTSPRSSRTVALRTCNGNYWSAPNGGGGLLGTVPITIGPNETFQLLERRNGQVALRSPSGQSVSIATTSPGLSANQSTIGPTESFDTVTPSTGVTNLVAANGKFVRAEGGGGSYLNALSDQAITWEAFNILNVRDAYGWERIDPNQQLTLNSAPTAAVSGNRILVFFRGTDNQLYLKTFDGTQWLPVQCIGGNLTGGVTAICTPGTSTVTAFHRGTAGTYSCWNDGTNGDWHLWGQLGGNAICGPAASSWGNGLMDVFSVDGNGCLIHTYWWNGAWVAWENRGCPLGFPNGATSGPPSGLAIVAPPAAVSWGPNNNQVIVRAQNDLLYSLTYDGSGWGTIWPIIDPSTLKVTSGPSVLSRGPGQLDVYARGTDYGLYHLSYANGAWTPSERLGGQLTSTPSAVIYQGRTHVFARGADNGLIRAIF